MLSCLPTSLSIGPEDFLFEGVRWIIEIVILFFLVFFLWLCVCTRMIRYFWKFPVPSAAGNAIAYGPFRRRIQPPSMISEALECASGKVMVEIGCGSGLYTIAVAKAVQPDGLVYAVDIQQGMLDKLASRMKTEGVRNIIPILADAEGKIPLDNMIADGIFSVTVLPEIPDPVKALRQYHRLLKDDGVFVDAEVLIDPDFPLRRTIRKWAKQAGFAFDGQFGNAARYVLIFRKKEKR